jgi:hypothetical protein
MGQLCCTGGTCVGSSIGCDGTRCVACGNTGQPCCDGDCGSGDCIDALCRPPDGSRGGRCIDGWRCDALAFCNFSRVCEGCGMAGEGCCGLGDCAGGLGCMGPVWERRCR